MYQKGPKNQAKWPITLIVKDLLASVQREDFAITTGLLSQSGHEEPAGNQNLESQNTVLQKHKTPLAGGALRTQEIDQGLRAFSLAASPLLTPYDLGTVYAPA